MSDETADDTSEQHPELLEVEALLRSLTSDDLSAPTPPPTSIWAGIQAGLGTTAAPTQAPSTGGSSTGAKAPVVSLDQRRSTRFGGMSGRLMAAAAAVVIVVAGAVAVVATRGGDDDGEVIATATLAFDATSFDPAGEGASATAQLVEADDGYEIVLTDTTLPARLEDDADLELWLIEVDEAGTPVDIASVALVDPSAPGRYDVPAGLDPATHSIVDISIEPRDGNHDHSGRSILRGPFADA